MEARSEGETPHFPGRALIIGSRGRMGKMLLERAEAAGLDVAGIDLPYENLESACKAIELAIFCVPARSLSNVLAQITPHLPRSAIVADITSVKEKPLAEMEKIWSGPVVGTHPLFGPKNEPGSDLPVAIVPGKNAGHAEVASVAAFLEKLGFRIFETGAEEHDRAMAKIQNLNFITTLAYFAALAGQEDLLPYLTPSFERRKAAAQKMLTEDAEMFSGLFEANPHSHEAARQYRRMLNLAAAGDIELLCNRARWWWRDAEKKN